MQKPRKRLSPELHHELTSFLDLTDQSNLLSLCRFMNALIGTRVREHLAKKKAFAHYLEAKFRRAMMPKFALFHYRPPARFFTRHMPLARLRAFRAMERKAYELFGWKGEKVLNKSLCEPIYANFLTDEFPLLNNKMFMIMSRLSEEHPKAKDEDLSLSNDYDKYNFDEIFPEWMDQLRADWEALNSLCAEMEKRRQWEEERKRPAYPCDIHSEAPVVQAHHCPANRVHHLCEECMRQVEGAEAVQGGQQQYRECHICLC